MTSRLGDTSDTLTRARVAAFIHPKKAPAAGHTSHLFARKKATRAAPLARPQNSDRPQVSQPVTHKKVAGNLRKPKAHRPPVTFTCPRCGHTITLEIPGTAYCRPCKQAMRPEGEGGKRQKRAQHGTNPPEVCRKRGSNRPIMHLIGGQTWHAHP